MSSSVMLYFFFLLSIALSGQDYVVIPMYLVMYSKYR